MKTITIQIGNTDDKLTQSEWAVFVTRCDEQIKEHAAEIHFSGCSNPVAKWQNCAWVIECEPADKLKKRLIEIRTAFRQDSIAWTEGETQFL